MTKKKSFYSAEFKTQATSLVREAKRPASEVWGGYTLEDKSYTRI